GEWSPKRKLAAKRKGMVLRQITSPPPVPLPLTTAPESGAAAFRKGPVRQISVYGLLFLIFRNVPGHTVGGGFCLPLLILSCVINANLGEVQRHILRQAILASRSTCGNRANEHLLHLHFDVFHRGFASLTHRQERILEMLAIAAS